MRYDYYRNLEIQQDLELFDILSVDFSKFTFDSQPQYYIVTSSDVIKPWFISQKFYGTIDYTDMRLPLNGVENPLEDLKPDMVLAIPSTSAMKNFFLNNKNFT
jgi:hypothetical protein